MKPYSTDFRAKIVETKYKTNQSIEQIASRFQVSYSFVQKLLKRYEATGSVEPKPHGGGKPAKLNPQQIEIVIQLVEEDNDATGATVMRAPPRKNEDESQCPNDVSSLTKVGVDPQKKDSSC